VSDTTVDFDGHQPHPAADRRLRSFLQERGLAVQKAPERLELVAALPMTATGKIQKHLLRQDVARKVEKAEQVPADA